MEGILPWFFLKVIKIRTGGDGDFLDTFFLFLRFSFSFVLSFFWMAASAYNSSELHMVNHVS